MFTSLVYRLLIVLTAYVTNISAGGIQGGVATSISAHPYVVSIQGKDGVRVCAGALINSNLVVTTAYCLTSYDMSKMVVSANNGAQVVAIAGKTFNERYDPGTNENDIGLLKLAQPVNAKVLSVGSTVKSASGVVTGWDGNNKLVDIPVKVLTREECANGKWYSKDAIPNSMFCGVAKDNNACGAITGSPVVANNFLVGVVSWASGCGNKGKPTVYTDLTTARAFITTTSNKFSG